MRPARFYFAKPILAETASNHCVIRTVSQQSIDDTRRLRRLPRFYPSQMASSSSRRADIENGH